MVELEPLLIAGRTQHVAALDYTDAKGETTTGRQVEPYEWRSATLDYWAWDMTKNEIRRFKLDRILNYQVLDLVFVPRFPWKES